MIIEIGLGIRAMGASLTSMMVLPRLMRLRIGYYDHPSPSSSPNFIRIYCTPLLLPGAVIVEKGDGSFGIVDV